MGDGGVDLEKQSERRTVEATHALSDPRLDPGANDACARVLADVVSVGDQQRGALRDSEIRVPQQRLGTNGEARPE